MLRKQWVCALDNGETDTHTKGHPKRRDSPEIHQEDMLNFLQDLQFSEHVSNFVSFYALLFVHVLHGVHLLSVFFLYNANLKFKERENVPLDEYLIIWLSSKSGYYSGIHKPRGKA